MPAVVSRAVICVGGANHAPVPRTIVNGSVAVTIVRRGVAVVIAGSITAIVAITWSAIIAVTWAVGVGAGGYATDHGGSN
jgi:hypothetical protein